MPVRDSALSDTAFLMTVEIPLKSTWGKAPFGSQLRGHFPHAFPGAYTNRSLSAHPAARTLPRQCLCCIRFLLCIIAPIFGLSRGIFVSILLINDQCHAVVDRNRLSDGGADELKLHVFPFFFGKFTAIIAYPTTRCQLFRFAVLTNRKFRGTLSKIYSRRRIAWRPLRAGTKQKSA